MNTKHFRLISIMAAGLLLAGILAFNIWPAGNAMAEANSPVGSWKVAVIQKDGLPPFNAMVIYSSDGTLSEIEDIGGVAQGVWQKISGNQYTFTKIGYIEMGGTKYQFKVWSQFTLNDKDHFSGPFISQIMDLQGKPLGVVTGNATGVRLQVEPIPDSQ
jgi:hypothetical protein